jgi:hypothetical protein
LGPIDFAALKVEIDEHIDIPLSFADFTVRHLLEDAQ